MCGLVRAVLCCEPKFPELNGGAHEHISTPQVFKKDFQVPKRFHIDVPPLPFSTIQGSTSHHHTPQGGFNYGSVTPIVDLETKDAQVLERRKTNTLGTRLLQLGVTTLRRTGYDTWDLSSISTVSGWIHSGFASFKAVRCS